LKEKIICFALGLSEEDIEKGKASFYGLHGETPKLDVIAVTEGMMAATVGEILDSAMAESLPDSAAEGQGPKKAILPGRSPYRVVVVNTMEREQVLQVMRSFKAVLSDPQDMIFAVITDTARTWTFGEYIGHLAKEHEYMKARNSGK